MAASVRHANSWQQGACQVATAAHCYHHSPTPSTQTQKKYHLSTVGLRGTFQVPEWVPLSSPVLYAQPKQDLPQDGIQSRGSLSQGGPAQLAIPSSLAWPLPGLLISSRALPTSVLSHVYTAYDRDPVFPAVTLGNFTCLRLVPGLIRPGPGASTEGPCSGPRLPPIFNAEPTKFLCCEPRG